MKKRDYLYIRYESQVGHRVGDRVKGKTVISNSDSGRHVHYFGPCFVDKATAILSFIESHSNWWDDSGGRLFLNTLRKTHLVTVASRSLQGVIKKCELWVHSLWLGTCACWPLVQQSCQVRKGEFLSFRRLPNPIFCWCHPCSVSRYRKKSLKRDVSERKRKQPRM